MLKRRLIWLLLAGVVLIGVLVMFLTCEPRYGGTKLSEWVDMLPPSPWAKRPPEVEHAIRQIGPKAVPYLLRRIRSDPPAWKSRLYPILNRILPTLNRSWKLELKRSQASPGKAMVAFYILGTSAKAAMGDLSKMLTDPAASNTQLRAASALVGIGSAGMPAVQSALTNQLLSDDVKWVILFNLGEVGTNARPAVPFLQELLSYPDPDVRIYATDALLTIDSEALRKARGQ